MAAKKRRGAPKKYPWTQWLRPGARTRLRFGREFKCSLRAMTVYLYQRAKLMGRRVSVIGIRNDTLEVRAYRVAANGRKAS